MRDLKKSKQRNFDDILFYFIREIFRVIHKVKLHVLATTMNTQRTAYMYTILNKWLELCQDGLVVNKLTKQTKIENKTQSLWCLMLCKFNNVCENVYLYYYYKLKVVYIIK